VLIWIGRSGKWRNGRRARFRSVCPKGRGGSTPPLPTHGMFSELPSIGQITPPGFVPAGLSTSSGRQRDRSSGTSADRRVDAPRIARHGGLGGDSGYDCSARVVRCSDAVWSSQVLTYGLDFTAGRWSVQQLGQRPSSAPSACLLDDASAVTEVGLGQIHRPRIGEAAPGVPVPDHPDVYPGEREGNQQRVADDAEDSSEAAPDVEPVGLGFRVGRLDGRPAVVGGSPVAGPPRLGLTLPRRLVESDGDGLGAGTLTTRRARGGRAGVRHPHRAGRLTQRTSPASAGPLKRW